MLLNICNILLNICNILELSELSVYFFFSGWGTEELFGCGLLRGISIQAETMVKQLKCSYACATENLLKTRRVVQWYFLMYFISSRGLKAPEITKLKRQQGLNLASKRKCQLSTEIIQTAAHFEKPKIGRLTL